VPRRVQSRATQRSGVRASQSGECAVAVHIEPIVEVDDRRPQHGLPLQSESATSFDGTAPLQRCREGFTSRALCGENLSVVGKATPSVMKHMPLPPQDKGSHEGSVVELSEFDDQVCKAVVESAASLNDDHIGLLPYDTASKKGSNVSFASVDAKAGATVVESCSSVKNHTPLSIQEKGSWFGSSDDERGANRSSGNKKQKTCSGTPRHSAATGVSPGDDKLLERGASVVFTTPTQNPVDTSDQDGAWHETEATIGSHHRSKPNSRNDSAEALMIDLQGLNQRSKIMVGRDTEISGESDMVVASPSGETLASDEALSRETDDLVHAKPDSKGCKRKMSLVLPVHEINVNQPQGVACGADAPSDRAAVRKHESIVLGEPLASAEPTHCDVDALSGVISADDGDGRKRHRQLPPQTSDTYAIHCQPSAALRVTAAAGDTLATLASAEPKCREAHHSRVNDPPGEGNVQKQKRTLRPPVCDTDMAHRNFPSEDRSHGASAVDDAVEESNNGGTGDTLASAELVGADSVAVCGESGRQICQKPPACETKSNYHRLLPIVTRCELADKEGQTPTNQDLVDNSEENEKQVSVETLPTTCCCKWHADPN